MERLRKLGFNGGEAERPVDLECGVLKKYPRNYLLEPDFTRMWFFGLSQPFFPNYPREKEDILRERFFTLSELCKLVDEAEWHFWNSHESRLPDEVWSEIFNWRLRGAGGVFAMRYFDMVSGTAAVPREKISAFSANEGKHLDLYRRH